MNINKNNYEAFFLDYHEGNLSPQQVADLLLFVEQHPELKEEFESFENFSIEDEQFVGFENKELLKKQIDTSNVEDYIINSIEGTLTLTEQQLLSSFIKQHPNYQTDFELFQKTKLNADDSIVFENKSELKRVDNMEELLISSMEGLLSKQEAALLNKQLTVDTKLQNDFAIYQQTKVVADTSIIYENKEALYRKERKVIPLFYYVAAAASVALLFSLFVFFNNYNNELKYTAKVIDSINQTTNTFAETKANNNSNETIVPETKEMKNTIAQVDVRKPKKIISKKNKHLVADSNTNNTSSNPSNNLSGNNTPANEKKSENRNSQLAPDQLPYEKNQTPNHQLPIAKNENNKAKEIPAEFLSLRQLAAGKIKEKTLDENTIAAQKKSGRDKKLSGWDFAQIVTKGISKLTGRNIEVKPEYNEQGDVIAYALGNELQVKRGR